MAASSVLARESDALRVVVDFECRMLDPASPTAAAVATSSPNANPPSRGGARLCLNRSDYWDPDAAQSPLQRERSGIDRNDDR